VLKYFITDQQHPEIINIRGLMERLSDNILPSTFQNVFCQLLFHFEVAIPIDKSHLFFPSLLLAHSQFHYIKLHHSFPRKVDLETLACELKNNFDNREAAEHGLLAPKNINLQPTGLFYRRFFVLTVVPVPLWPRLISRCLTDSKFTEIVKKNCLHTLSFEPLQNLGKMKVGNTILEWIYWKNGIELRLSGVTLLQISSVDLTGCTKETESIPSQTNVKGI